MTPQSLCTWFIQQWSNLPGPHPDCLDKVDGVEVADVLDILGVVAQLV